MVGCSLLSGCCKKWSSFVMLLLTVSGMLFFFYDHKYLCAGHD